MLKVAAKGNMIPLVTNAVDLVSSNFSVIHVGKTIFMRYQIHIPTTPPTEKKTIDDHQKENIFF